MIRESKDRLSGMINRARNIAAAGLIGIIGLASNGCEIVDQMSRNAEKMNFGMASAYLGYEADKALNEGDFEKARSLGASEEIIRGFAQRQHERDVARDGRDEIIINNNFNGGTAYPQAGNASPIQIEPYAEFHKLFIEYGATEGALEGIRVHSWVNLRGLKDKDLQVKLFFRYVNNFNDKLRDLDGKYATSDGLVGVESPKFRPDSDTWGFGDYSMFIPWNQIDLPEKGEYDILLELEILKQNFYGQESLCKAETFWPKPGFDAHWIKEDRRIWGGNKPSYVIGYFSMKSE